MDQPEKKRDEGLPSGETNEPETEESAERDNPTDASVSAPAQASAPPADQQGREQATGYRRWLLMQPQIAQAHQQELRAGKPGWESYRAAQTAFDGAQSFHDMGERQGSAVILLQQSALLSASAATEFYGLPPADFAEAVDALRQHSDFSARLSELDATQWELAKTTAVASVRDIPSWSEVELRRRLGALDKLCTGLMDVLARRAAIVARVKTIRAVKLIAPLVLVVIALIAVALLTRVSPKDSLALGAQVKVSSRNSGSPSPSELVDGTVGRYGFHTKKTNKPWVEIDMKEVRPIERIIVQNRLDCCQERAVPLIVEVSVDGKKYQKIAEKKETFERWEIEHETQARYIRLKVLKNTYFHLSEVMVY